MPTPVIAPHTAPVSTHIGAHVNTPEQHPTRALPGPGFGLSWPPC